MLKAFPNKAAGAIAMIASMVILLSAPWADNIASIGSIVIDTRYRPLFRLIFLVFVTNMFILG